MDLFRHCLTRFRILSLDVVLGALASGSMVVELTGVDMPGLWWLALPLSVWVIYTADHLMDAYRLKDRAHTDRHLFHYRHFVPIFGVWAVLLLVCLVWVPFQLPLQLVYFGLGMGGLTLVHLALVSWIGDRISGFLHKEIGVGLIYAAGVWGGPLSLSTALNVGIGLAGFQFFLLALFNLLLFSMYEIRSDELDGHTSFVRAIGVHHTRTLLMGLGVTVLVLAAPALACAGDLIYMLAVQLIYLSMLAVLFAIAVLPKYFEPSAHYRAWGDAVFLFPALVWLLSIW